MKIEIVRLKDLEQFIRLKKKEEKLEKLEKRLNELKELQCKTKQKIVQLRKEIKTLRGDINAR